MTTPATLFSPLRVFLGLVIAATLGLAIDMARPWGDNYAYQGIADYLRLAAFLLWAISPLAALAAGAGLFRHARMASRVYVAGAIVIALAGVFAYVDAALLHPDAQGGLVFLFAPLFQWAAVLCLGAVCAVMRRATR